MYGKVLGRVAAWCQLGAVALSLVLVVLGGLSSPVLAATPLVSRLREITQQVTLGTVPAGTAADSILAALAGGVQGPDAELAQQCLLDALKATLISAGTLHAGAEQMDVHPFPHGGKSMLTPRDEGVRAVMADFLAVYDRLEVGLEACGLSQLLPAIEAGLNIWYDVPQAQPGEVCRLRVSLASANELSRRRASVTLHFAGLSVAMQAESLAGTPIGCSEELARVSLYVYTSVGALELVQGEPGLPSGLSFAGVKLSSSTVFDDAGPLGSAGDGTMLLSIPVSWGQSIPSSTIVRLYYCPLGGTWQYRPGAIDPRGRLEAEVPVRDGTVVLLTPTTTPLGVPAPDVAVVVNGERVALDVAPRILSGRVLVPLRAVVEPLGSTLDWDGSSGRVTLVREGRTVILDTGGNSGSVDGRAVVMDVPAFISEGRVLVPLRFVGEALGAVVVWDSSQRIVNVQL